MPIYSGNTCIYSKKYLSIISEVRSNLRYTILPNSALSSLYGIFLLESSKKKVFPTKGWHLNGKQDSLHHEMSM